MAIKNRFRITRRKPGANATGLLTSPSGFLLNGVAVAGKLVLGDVYTITTPDALVGLGITAAYDAANKVLVYYHLTEFFRMAGEGTELNFMVIPQAITPLTALTDATGIYAKKLLIAAQGRIRQLGLAFNPDNGTYVDVLTDGFNTDIRAAIPAAKLLRDWASDRMMDIGIVLEGRKWSGNEATCVNLRNIIIGADTVAYEGIQVVIGQDWDFAQTLDVAWTLGRFHAAVGTLLGTLAGIEMQQDEGEVETLDITNTDLLKFINPGLSDHTKVADVNDKLDMLDDKGYVFPIKYTGVTGWRWNGDHVCAPIIIDAEGIMNEHKMAYSRTIGECRRAIYTKLIGKVRTAHKVDATTGKLPVAKIKFFEALGDQALLGVSGLSAGKTYVDPNSDLFRPPQELAVSFTAVPQGTIGTINGIITLKTQL